MSKADLPSQRLLSNAFKEQGRDDVVKIEVFPIRDGDILKLTFESKNSQRRQGVWLRSDRCLIVNGQQCSSVQLWQDTAPTEVLIECHTRDGRLHLYNIWDKGNGRNSQSWTSGMLVEEIANGRRYFCNDFGFDTAFDKLVFRIQRV